MFVLHVFKLSCIFTPNSLNSRAMRFRPHALKHCVALNLCVVHVEENFHFMKEPGRCMTFKDRH